MNQKVRALSNTTQYFKRFSHDLKSKILTTYYLSIKNHIIISFSQGVCGNKEANFGHSVEYVSTYKACYENSLFYQFAFKPSIQFLAGIKQIEDMPNVGLMFKNPFIMQHLDAQKFHEGMEAMRRRQKKIKKFKY